MKFYIFVIVIGYPLKGLSHCPAQLIGTRCCNKPRYVLMLQQLIIGPYATKLT